MYELILTIESENTGIVKCWVDDDFAVHDNMRLHVGRTKAMGKGTLNSSF